MQIPFRCEPEGSGPQPREIAGLWTPQLLVELPSWPRVFFGNLRDLLFARFRPDPPPGLTSSSAPFWPDVFVQRRLPIAPFRKSALYHIFAVVALWGFTHTWLMHPRVEPRSPFEKTRIVYYPVSEYLPALEDNSEPAPARIEKKGDPVYARQRIVSTPRHPDNVRQTILTPAPPVLRAEVSLPNIVAWTPAPVPTPVPTAAVTSMSARLSAPVVANPVTPPPDPARARLIAPALPQPDPVAPPPAVVGQSKLPKIDIGAAIAPAPVVNLRPKLPAIAVPEAVAPSPLIMARSKLPSLPAPTPVAPPPSTASVRSIADLKAYRPAAAPVVAPPVSASSLAGMGTKGAVSAGQIIALGVQPEVARGPVTVPQGNRRGTFAASPEGRPGAAGTPNLLAGNADGSGGLPSGMRTGGALHSPIAGLTIATAPSANASPAPATTTVAKPPASTPNAFAAALGSSRVADIARKTVPGPVAPEPKVEDLGVGPKKYYSMTLNMPNLTSSAGSWIIHFAELKEAPEKGPLTAPVATVKVDPAYPSILARERIEGVVLLYAIIRADGAVGNVRVLRGIDARLDDSARAALTRWHFRPGTRNGTAVDLEAVVQIPFRAQPAF